MGRWTRSADDGRTNTGATYSWGPWRAAKSFYADGPTLFVWLLTNVENPAVHQEYPTLRWAKKRAEHFDEHGFEDDQPEEAT